MLCDSLAHGDFYLAWRQTVGRTGRHACWRPQFGTVHRHVNRVLASGCVRVWLERVFDVCSATDRSQRKSDLDICQVNVTEDPTIPSFAAKVSDCYFTLDRNGGISYTGCLIRVLLLYGHSLILARRGRPQISHLIVIASHRRDTNGTASVTSW